MRALGPLCAGHSPTPAVVVTDLQNASCPDTPSGERNAVAATLERDRAGI